MVRTLDRESLIPERLTVREPSLDDVFLSLTGHRAEETRRRTRQHAATTNEVRHDRDHRVLGSSPPVAPPASRRRSAHRVTPTVAVADGIVVAWRNLLSMLRTPEVLVFSSIQPVIFVLMFRFVFGGAITVPGESYVNFLMPGIFIQTVAFGSVTTAIGMATDLQGGVIDRFRSLPMARSAVLAGRTIADLVRSVWVVILMAVGRHARRLPRADERARRARGGRDHPALRVRARRGSSRSSGS